MGLFGRGNQAEDNVVPMRQFTVQRYRDLIQRGEELPTIKLQVEGAGQPVLKPSELVHYAEQATLDEKKTVNLGYQGRSKGLSVPLSHGFRARVGSSRGHVVKQERWVPTSSGVLVLTNQRLLLHPTGATKPVSIPLKKILSYQPVVEGLLVFKEGREKGYLFEMKNQEAGDIFGLCLGYLLDQG